MSGLFRRILCSLILTGAVVPATMAKDAASDNTASENAASESAPPEDAEANATELPDVLAMQDGRPVNDPAQWPARRAELVELFTQHVYGRMPDQRRIAVQLQRREQRGQTIRYELDVRLLPLVDEVPAHGVPVNGPSNAAIRDDDAPGAAAASADEGGGATSDKPPVLQVLVEVPATASAEHPAPAFLGLNFQGNHTLDEDPQIRITDSWVRNRGDGSTEDHRALEKGRGVAASRWPIGSITDRGYALVTLYYGDIDPDFDDGFQNGVHGVLRSWIDGLPETERPGSIAAWAYGLSAVLDALEQTPELHIDPAHVAVIGHSRLGKTALWAGAVDPRFALVISNDSGCGGAAISRRAVGETVAKINSSFPHWFCDRFNEYNDNEQNLPVDQHQLIAASAPRPVAVGSASEDAWADPEGEFLGAVHASPAYELFGLPGLIGNTPGERPSFPDPGEALSAGAISYHLRGGKHDLTIHDWQRYMDFADRHLKIERAPSGSTSP